MYRSSYKEWPECHKRLLHYTISVLMLTALIYWSVIYPRARKLKVLQQNVEATLSEMEKQKTQLDAQALYKHVTDCITQLSGDDNTQGLIDTSNNAIAYATSTFTKEIQEAYPGENADELFIEKSSKIDYKDLYDRVTSEFDKIHVKINQKVLDPDDDSQDPVYHQILKLLTIRNIVRLANKNNLEIECNEEKISRIHAMRTVVYKLTENDKPYLLEFPVSIRLYGTMEQFLAFAKSLQQDEQFLPIKNISIYTTPPTDFPPAAKRTISKLHFRITCSSYFSLPPEKETPTPTIPNTQE